ncbi:hypothetical protein BMS3Bbin11_00311 [bacterium BMS3Bbin11]|nr:hypothetical protein BMS3Bbin11_00311 [bacterium BMS3Bbin11]
MTKASLFENNHLEAKYILGGSTIKKADDNNPPISIFCAKCEYVTYFLIFIL